MKANRTQLWIVWGGALGFVLSWSSEPDAAISLFAERVALSAQRETVTAILMPLSDKALKHEDYKLTDALHGVSFDVNGDGYEEQTSWTDPDSGLAFLALDRNGNGKIDNGKELFGNFTRPDSSNGFAALLREAGPYGAFGSIEDGHPLFEKLLLWEDANHNGLSDPGEIQKFSDHYVFIGLSYEPDTLEDGYGNEFRFKGDAVTRTEESKKMPKNPVKCKGWSCQTDRSEELSRIIDIYDVRFLVK